MQPDDAYALRLLAPTARSASRLVEQSRPARGKWARHLFVVHNGSRIRVAWPMAARPGPLYEPPACRQSATAARRVYHPLSDALRRRQGVAARTIRGLPDEPRSGCFLRRLGAHPRLWPRCRGTIAGYGVRLDYRRLVVLRSTPFRARIVGAGSKLEFRCGFAGKHLLSTPAPRSPVVHRKYRFSSRPPC